MLVSNTFDTRLPILPVSRMTRQNKKKTRKYETDTQIIQANIWKQARHLHDMLHVQST
jgi:hypothetical protein